MASVEVVFKITHVEDAGPAFHRHLYFCGHADKNAALGTMMEGSIRALTPYLLKAEAPADITANEVCLVLVGEEWQRAMLKSPVRPGNELQVVLIDVGRCVSVSPKLVRLLDPAWPSHSFIVGTGPLFMRYILADVVPKQTGWTDSDLVRIRDTFVGKMYHALLVGYWGEEPTVRLYNLDKQLVCKTIIDSGVAVQFLTESLIEKQLSSNAMYVANARPQYPIELAGCIQSQIPLMSVQSPCLPLYGAFSPPHARGSNNELVGCIPNQVPMMPVQQPNLPLYAAFSPPRNCSSNNIVGSFNSFPLKASPASYAPLPTMWSVYRASELSVKAVKLGVHVLGEDPDYRNFWIRTEGTISYLKTLRAAFDKTQFAMLKSPTPNVGCIVMDVSDGNGFQRGFIEEVNENWCTVFFVDYGERRVIDQRHIFVTDDEVIKSTPVCAVQVSLNQCESLEPYQEARKIFGAMVKGRILSCRVKVQGLVQSVELYNEMGESIKDAVLAHFPQSKIPQSKIAPLPQVGPRAAKFHVPATPLGVCEDLFVMFTEEVGRFFGQFEKLSTPELEQLQTELLEVYGKLEQAPLLYADVDSHLGDFGVVKFSEDQQFYRVKIKEEKATSVVAAFIDYGNVVEVHRKQVFAAVENLQFFEKSNFGIWCILLEAPIVSKEKWREIFLEKSISVKIMRSVDGKETYEVALTDDNRNSQIRDDLKNLKKDLTPPLPSQKEMPPLLSILENGSQRTPQGVGDGRRGGMRFGDRQSPPDVVPNGERNSDSKRPSPPTESRADKDDNWRNRSKFVEFSEQKSQIQQTTNSGGSPKLYVPPPQRSQESGQSPSKFKNVAPPTKVLPASALSSKNTPEKLKPKAGAQKQFPKQAPLQRLKKAVHVVHVESPTDFFCQLSEVVGQLDEIMNRLALVYEDDRKLGLDPKDAVPGAVCVAQFADDGAWYRGQIIAIEGTQANVHFVDYGNNQKSPLSGIKAIEEEFVALPPQAYRCRLAGVRPPKGGWAEETKRFENLTMEIELNAFISSADEGKYPVRLWCQKSGTESAAINESFGAPSVSDPVADYPVMVVPKPGSYGVSFYYNPNKFFLSVGDRMAYQDQLDLLEEFYSSLEDGALLENEPRVGLACVARYVEDGLFYRCQITAVNKTKTRVRLLFVDYGNEQEAAINEVRRIVSSFSNIPRLALPCGLRSVSLVEPRSQVPSTFEKSCFVDVDTLCVNFYAAAPDGYFPADLNAPGIGDVRDHLIQKKVVQPLPSRTVAAPLAGAPVSNAGPSAHQTKAVKSTLVAAPPTEVPVAILGPGVPQLPKAEKFPDGQIIAKKTLVPHVASAADSPAGDEEVEVYVSYSFSPSNFYLHLKRDEEDIQKIQDDLYNQFSGEEDPEWQVGTPVVGSIYAVVHPEYDTWYRGLLLRLDGGQARVRFIDYGDESDADAACIRRLLPEKLASVPAMATAASIVPGVSGRAVRWTDETCKRFAAETFDVLFKAVLGPTEGGVRHVKSISGQNGDLVPIFASLCEVEAEKKECLPPVVQLDQELGAPAVVEKEVYVSYALSPSKFYLHAKTDEETIQRIQDDLYNQFFAEDPSWRVDVPVVGSIYAVVHPEFDTWYRGALVNCNGGKARFQFIDYGDEADIDVANIRRLLPEHLTTMPAMANGAIIDLGRDGHADASWSEEVCKQFTDATTDKLFKAVVVSGEGGVQLVKSLTVDGQDLVPVFAAQLARGRVEESATEVIEEEVYVSHARSPTKFYLHMKKDEQTLQQIQDDLYGQFSGKEDPDWRVGAPVVGSIYAAVHPDYDTWFRGLLLSLAGDRATFHFIDYGDEGQVDVSLIRRLLPEHLADLHAMAVEASIECGVDRRAVSWKEEVCKQFATMTSIDVLFKAVLGPAEDGVQLVKSLSAKDGDLVSMFAGQLELNALDKKVVFVEEKQEVYVAYALSPSKFYLQMKSDEQALKQIQDDLFNQFAQPEDPSWLVDAPVVGSTYAAVHPLYDTWYRAIVKHVKGDMLCVQFIDYGDEADVVVANIRHLLPEHLKTVPSMAFEASIDLGQGTVLWPEDICQQFASATLEDPFTADFGPVVNGVQLVRSLAFEGNDLVPVFTALAFPAEQMREDATEAGNDSSCFSEALSEYVPTVPVSDTPPRQEVSIEFFDFPKDDSEAQPVQLLVETAQDSQGNLVGTEANQEEMFIELAEGDLKEPDAGIPQIQVGDELVSSEFASCPQSPAGEEFAAASDYGNPTGAEVDLVPPVVEGVRVLASDEEGSLMEDVPQKSPLDGTCEQLDTAVEDVVEAYISYALSPTKFWLQMKDSDVELGAIQNAMEEYYSDGNNPPAEELCVGSIYAVLHPEFATHYRGMLVSVSGSRATIKFVDYGDEFEVDVGMIYRLMPESLISLPAMAVEASMQFDGVDHLVARWSQEACDQFKSLVADVLFKIVLGPVKDGVQLVRAIVANGADLVPAFGELLRSSTPVPEGFLKSDQ